MPLSTLANIIMTRFRTSTDSTKRRSISTSRTTNDESKIDTSMTQQYDTDYLDDISPMSTPTNCLRKMTHCFIQQDTHRTPQTRRYKQYSVDNTIQYTNDGIEHNQYNLDSIINTYSTYTYSKYTSPDVTPYQTPQHSPRTSLNNKHTGKKLLFDFNSTTVHTQTIVPYKYNNNTTPIVQLPTELQELICEFLQFKDVCNFALSCSELVSLCNNKQQLSLQVLPYKPVDKGDGLGCELIIHSDNIQQQRNDWRIAYCTRETIYNRVYNKTGSYLCKSDVTHATQHITVILSILCSNVRDINCVEESLRWIVQLHDTYGDALITPICSDDTIKCIISMFKRYINKPNIIQMTSKVVGILSTQEQNRPKMTEFNGVKHLLHCITLYIHNIKILANICWALVIIARPLGACEGSTFLHPAKQTTANIKHIVDNNGIENLIYIIQQHKYSPHVLTKAYWCLVNLSIVSEHKQKAIELKATELIIESMTLFPTHPQLQYRAAFALINLAIRPDVKVKLRDLGAIELLVAGMIQFSKYQVYQKCACVVLRSICYGSPSNCQRLITLGGVELICNFMYRWRNNTEYVKLGLTTLECIEIPYTFIDRVEAVINEIDINIANGTIKLNIDPTQSTIREQLEQSEETDGYKIPNIAVALQGTDTDYDKGMTEEEIMAQEEQAKKIQIQKSG